MRAIDEAGQRPDGIDALVMQVSGVGSAPGSDRDQAPGALSPRDDGVVRAARLEDEATSSVSCRGLEDGLTLGRSDLFVAHDDEADGHLVEHADRA